MSQHKEGQGRLLAAIRQEQACDRFKARLILRTGGFSAGDLLQMLRAQIISDPLEYHCSRGEHDPCQSGLTARRLPVWPRTTDQPDPDGPFDPARAPPSVLRCPLDQRSERRAPCSVVQHRLAIREHAGPGEFSLGAEELDLSPEHFADPGEWLAYSFRRRSIQPCEIFYELAKHYIRSTFYRKRTEQVPVPPPPEGGTAEAALQQILYLLDSGRLRWEDFIELLKYGIYMTGPGWVPCQDDGQRDQFDLWDEAEKTEIHTGRMRCPLQVRAILGERGVACVEAQDLHPPESLVRAARKALPEGLGSRGAGAEDAAAGTAEDPVRRLGLRPCQLMGQVLIRGLTEVLGELAEEERSLEGAREVVASCAPAAPDEPAGQASWTA